MMTPPQTTRLRRLGAVVLTAFVAWHVAFGQVPADRTDYELPGEGVFPEGIAYHEPSGSFFVSGAGSGGIYRVDLESGEVTTFVEPGTRSSFSTIGMDVSGDQLWVAGGSSGEVLIYDVGSGERIGAYTTPQADARFLNDVVVTQRGDAFITDSNRPVLWQVAAGNVAQAPEGEAEDWLSFEGTPFEYAEGFNANGIVASDDGLTLLVVNAGQGTLFRIDVETKEVTQVDLGGETVPGGDGMVLDGNTLYVVQNGADQVSVITLSDDFSSGTLDRVIEDERLADSATAALVGSNLLVVNAQFSAMQGEPTLPFTVSVVPIE